MRTLVRYLLAIMVVVLPLQGTAAILMSYHAPAAAVAAGTHAATDADADAAQTATAGEHCAHAGAAPVKPKATHIKCNAGANCCIGAVAPPSAPIKLPTHFTSTEEQAAREPAMIVFVPHTLERPPRLS